MRRSSAWFRLYACSASSTIQRSACPHYCCFAGNRARKNRNVRSERGVHVFVNGETCIELFLSPSLLWSNRAVHKNRPELCGSAGVLRANHRPNLYGKPAQQYNIVVNFIRMHMSAAPSSAQICPPRPRILRSMFLPSFFQSACGWLVTPPAFLASCDGSDLVVENRINSRAQKFAENSPTTKGRGKMVKFMFLGDAESGKTAIVTRWDRRASSSLHIDACNGRGGEGS